MKNDLFKKLISLGAYYDFQEWLLSETPKREIKITDRLIKKYLKEKGYDWIRKEVN